MVVTIIIEIDTAIVFIVVIVVAAVDGKFIAYTAVTVIETIKYMVKIATKVIKATIVAE